MSTFRPYPRASSELAQMIGDSPVLDKVAQKIAGRWRVLAPRRYGEYRKSIRVNPIPYNSSSGVVVQDRLVHSVDEAAHLIEYGYRDSKRNITVAGHFVLTKVLEGLRGKI